MNIIELKLSEIKPYEKNPRNNDEAVKYVSKSIEEFGFKIPIIVDKDNIIVCGHTRYKAAQQLNMKTVPCVIADDLTEEQIKAFRLADNKVGELAEWDYKLLDEEIKGILSINMEDFDLTFSGIDTEELEAGLSDEFREAKYNDDEFSITLQFPIDKEEVVKRYIKETGKDIIVLEILDYIEKHQEDETQNETEGK